MINLVFDIMQQPPTQEQILEEIGRHEDEAEKLHRKAVVIGYVEAIPLIFAFVTALAGFVAGLGSMSPSDLPEDLYNLSAWLLTLPIFHGAVGVAFKRPLNCFFAVVAASIILGLILGKYRKRLIAQRDKRIDIIRRLSIMPPYRLPRLTLMCEVHPTLGEYRSRVLEMKRYVTTEEFLTMEKWAADERQKSTKEMKAEEISGVHLACSPK